MGAKKAYRLSVLVVEAASGVAAVACRDSDTCAVGRGQSVDAAVAHSVAALEHGHTQSKAEAREILRSADDVWSEDFRRQALSEPPRRRKHRR